MRGRREREHGDDGREAWAETPPKIGPAAHVGAARGADTGTAVDDRLPAVLTEIRSLLELPRDAAPSRALVEDTLTTGYAYALGLEGDRLRIERSLRSLLRGDRRPDPRRVAELSGRLDRATEELAGVRALLASLRAQALTRR